MPYFIFRPPAYAADTLAAGQKRNTAGFRFLFPGRQFDLPGG